MGSGKGEVGKGIKVGIKIGVGREDWIGMEG